MKIAVADYSFPGLDIEVGVLQPLGNEIVGRNGGKSASELTKLVADLTASAG